MTKSTQIIATEFEVKHTIAREPGEALGTSVRNGLTWVGQKTVGNVGGRVTGFVRGFARGVWGQPESKPQAKPADVLDKSYGAYSKDNTPVRLDSTIG